MAYDKLAYDRAYRAANRERERSRRQEFDKSPRRHVKRVASATWRRRVGAVERMRKEVTLAS